MSCCSNVILNPVVSNYVISLDGSGDKVVATGYKGVTGASARSFSWRMKVNTFSGTKCVFDYGDTGAGSIRLYMNGEEQLVHTYDGGDYSQAIHTAISADFAIGERFADGAINIDADFDEFAIFNIELTPEEVRAIYNNGDGLELTVDNGPYQKSRNLQLYWKFEEGSGSTAQDSSPHNRDGAITGATYVSA